MYVEIQAIFSLCSGPIDATKTGFTNYTTTVVCTPDTSYPLTIEARDAFGNIALYKADQNNYFKIKVTEVSLHDTIKIIGQEMGV